MPFIPPMLASPIKAQRISPGEWCAEEKMDGHRLIVSVGGDGATLFEQTGVLAWSRDALPRVLPSHLREALAQLPAGTYDGELLVPGERSYGVTVLESSDRLVYVIFDVLNLLGRDVTANGLGASYNDRRVMLDQLTALTAVGPDATVRVAWSRPITSIGDAWDIATEVWSRDGEGLILKRRAAPYTIGKRTRDWLKIKQLRSACLTVIGFGAGTMSPNSVVFLRDDEGHETSVKWKNLVELAKIDANPSALLGRKLWIEYQERTPDGSYRHPRWDRWDGE